MNDDPKQVKEKVLELSWLQQTMALINKCTPDIKGKAFDPDWFVLRQHLEQAAAIIGRKNVYGKEGEQQWKIQPKQKDTVLGVENSSPTPEATKGVQPTQAEQDEKLCEELRVAFHTATEMGLPFSASALDTAIKRIRELSKPVEPAVKSQFKCPACGTGFHNPELLGTPFACPQCHSTLIKTSSMETPNWLPISQCDLKPGESFWYIEYGKIIVKEEGLQNSKNFFQSYPHITHFLRATGCYQIPKPPVKVEDDLSKAIYTYKHMCPRWTEERLNDFILGYEASRASITEKGGKDE